MKLYEMNPFLRYAGINRYSGSFETVSGYDHRIFYAVDGELKIHTCGNQYTIGADDMFMCKGGVAYKLEIDRPIRIIALNFDFTQKNRALCGSMSPEVLERFDSGRILENVLFDDAEALNEPLVVRGASELKVKLRYIAELHSRKELYYMERCSAVLKEVIIDMLQNTFFSSSSASAKIENVIAYISENYSKALSNEDIARVVNYHPYHLNRLMIKYTGCTLHKYLLNTRLEKAVERLVGRADSVAEIAESCGFSSSYHFSAAFRRKYNCTPSQYRKAHKNML